MYKRNNKKNIKILKLIYNEVNCKKLFKLLKKGENDYEQN